MLVRWRPASRGPRWTRDPHVQDLWRGDARASVHRPGRGCWLGRVPRALTGPPPDEDQVNGWLCKTCKPG